jgi:hypothetical protein
MTDREGRVRGRNQEGGMAHPLVQGRDAGCAARILGGQGLPHDLADALLALQATGMAPWDAMMALVDADVDPAAFLCLEGLPTRALRVFSDACEAVAVFEGVAKHNGVAANRGLNAWLEGRRVEERLPLDELGWLTSLPRGLVVAGALDLMGSMVEDLPDDLRVEQTLDLSKSAILRLPRGLWVGRSLVADFTDLRSLPEGLRVGGSLDLEGSQVRALPRDLTLGRSLVLANTPISTLPEDFRLKGSLDLSGTPIKALPAGLSVGGNLDLRGCAHWDRVIPEGAMWGKRLFTDRLDHQGIGYEDWRTGRVRGPGGVRP